MTSARENCREKSIPASDRLDLEPCTLFCDVHVLNLQFFWQKETEGLRLKNDKLPSECILGRIKQSGLQEYLLKRDFEASAL